MSGSQIHPAYAAGERVLLALRVGGMWVIGFMAAPVIFSVLERRSQPGMAGHLFGAISYLGLGCGGVLLAGQWYRRGPFGGWRVGVLAAMLLLVAVGEFGLEPFMDTVRSAGAVDRARFAWPHGVRPCCL